MNGTETAKASVARNIKKFREVAGLTQKDLSETLKISVSAISLWESGKTSPNANQLVQLCDIFDKPPTVMFGLVDEDATREQEKDVLHRLYAQAPDHVKKAVDALLRQKG
jgi:transcriptional regulator with XRE-family HTH domain